MAVFITSDSQQVAIVSNTASAPPPPPAVTTSPQIGSLESEGTAAARSLQEQQSTSRYENVASSAPPSSSRPSIHLPLAASPLPRHSLHHYNYHRHSRVPSLPSPISAASSFSSSPSSLLNRHSTRRHSTRPHTMFSMSSPGSWFARLKSVYERSPLHHFGPWLLLLLYALFGALLFFWLEAANERKLFRQEQNQLDRLRGETVRRMGRTSKPQQREVLLLWFEQELAKTKLPEALVWDFWGALFYVGTVFTTIGYGNITPRTTAGQAFSILYAIVGIPLVLALLSQTSKRMTRWLSNNWISYRKAMRRMSAGRRKNKEWELEEGNAAAATGIPLANDQEEVEAGEEEMIRESRTIPVWLAMALVSGYVCTIAGIFLLWESRWSYFTSFYFICISCLTIGLGDVIPDHPHMLCLMFVFVIFGLSFVSMLISVIQIKMEEWLYRMLVRIQNEYQRALEGVIEPAERERLLEELFAREPWYMRELAPLCVSEQKTAQLDAMAQQFERLLLPMNTRAVQTDEQDWLHFSEKNDIDEKNGDETAAMALEQQREREQQEEEKEARQPKRQNSPLDEMFAAAPATVAISTNLNEQQQQQSAAIMSRTESFQSVNSVSDATSLPMDPAIQVLAPTKCSREMQTEPEMHVEIGIGTEWLMGSENVGTQTRAVKMTSRNLDTNGLIVMMERAVGDDGGNVESREVQTDGDDDKQRGERQRRRQRGVLSRVDSLDLEEEEEVQDRSCQCTPPAALLAQNSVEVQTERKWPEEEEQQQIVDDSEDVDTIQEGIDILDGRNEGRERSESMQVLAGDELDRLLDAVTPNNNKQRSPERRDLVIQTDDSYLRIARRLDNLRTAKSEINIYCTGVGVPKKVPPTAASRRKSLYFLEPAREMIRDSFRRHQMKQEQKKVAAAVAEQQQQQQQNLEQQQIDVVELFDPIQMFSCQGETSGGGSISLNVPQIEVDDAGTQQQQNSPKSTRNVGRRVRLPPETEEEKG